MNRFILFGLYGAVAFFLPTAYAAPTVSSQPLAEVLFHPLQEAPATVLSLNDAPLSLEVSGTIVEVAVLVGQWVERGDLLLRLDGWSYQNQVQQAQASLEESLVHLSLAQVQQKRTARLRKNGQASEEQFDQREAELHTVTAHIKQLQAVRQAAQDRLDKTRLLAPFAGVIRERMAQVGAWVSPGLPLVRLIDPKRLELSAQIRPSQRGQFDRAWQGDFNQEGLSYPLRLRIIVPVEDPQTRTQEARFEFKPGDALPLPGAAGRLVWRDPRLHMPARFLVRRGGLLGVFFAEGNSARFQAVPQALEGQPAVWDPSFLQGDLILSGRESLTDGGPIQRVAGTTETTE